MLDYFPILTSIQNSGVGPLHPPEVTNNIFCFMVSSGTHKFKHTPRVSIHCSYCSLWCSDFPISDQWEPLSWILSCFPSSDKTMSPVVIDSSLTFWNGKISKLGNRNISFVFKLLFIYFLTFYFLIPPTFPEIFLKEK